MKISVPVGNVQRDAVRVDARRVIEVAVQRAVHVLLALAFHERGDGVQPAHGLHLTKVVYPEGYFNG